MEVLNSTDRLLPSPLIPPSPDLSPSAHCSQLALLGGHIHCLPFCPCQPLFCFPLSASLSFSRFLSRSLAPSSSISLSPTLSTFPIAHPRPSLPLTSAVQGCIISLLSGNKGGREGGRKGGRERRLGKDFILCQKKIFVGIKMHHLGQHTYAY